MGRAERVVNAFGALGEAGKPARLAQRADVVAAPRQDLVRVALMADIPDQLVVGRVEDMVQRDRQLDDAKARAEMAARDRDGGDRLLPQFLGQLLQLRNVEVAHVGGDMHAVKQRCLRHVSRLSGLHRSQDVSSCRERGDT